MAGVVSAHAPPCQTPTPACSALLKPRGGAEHAGVCSPRPPQRPLLGDASLAPVAIPSGLTRALWAPPRASLPGVHAVALTWGHQWTSRALGWGSARSLGTAPKERSGPSGGCCGGAQHVGPVGMGWGQRGVGEDCGCPDSHPRTRRFPRALGGSPWALRAALWPWLPPPAQPTAALALCAVPPWKQGPHRILLG